MDPSTPKITESKIKKEVKCYGCYLFEIGKGGENQQSHTGLNGCLQDE